MSKQLETLINLLDDIKRAIDKKAAANLELNKWKSMIQGLYSLAPNCEECSKQLQDVEEYLTQLKKKANHSEEIDYKKHKLHYHTISNHLTKQHEIITSGYYLSIFMSIGSGLGLVFGMLIFDNMILGLVFGAAIGLVIGTTLDANARNKGQML